MSPLLGSIGGISEYNYRGTLDDWPTPFSFGNLINVEPGSVVGVSTVITGINYKASIISSTGSLISVRNIVGITSIYSGDSATPSTTVTVSIAKSTTDITVGKNIRIINVSDTDYNGEYLVSSVIDAPYVTRFTYELSQVPGDANPGVSTAEFNYEVYPFVEDQQIYIRNNQILEVRIPTTSGSNADFDKQYRTTVRVGKRYADWSIRTRIKDNSPDAFFFSNVEGMNIGIATVSDSITIQGLEPGVPSYAFISSGIGSFSLNGSSGITTANVFNGDVIYIYETASDYYSTTKTSTITVGDYTASFNVRTRPVDKVPNQFTFNTLVDVPINQEQVSISTSLSGADNNIPLNALVSYPGQLKVNSGEFISGSTEVFNGDTVSLKIPASVIKEYSTTYSTQLTVTGINSVFSVTSRPRPIKTFPDQFQFTDLSDVSPNILTESSIITLSGMTIGIGDTGSASIFGVGSEFRVFRNGSVIRDYSSESFPVFNSDNIQLRVVSPGEGSLSQTRFVVSGTDTRDVVSGIDGFTSDTWDVSSRFLNCKISEDNLTIALSPIIDSKIRELKFTSFVVSGLDNGCDTIITTSNPDSYIRNQNGIQVSSSQPLDIKNGDTITVYMTAPSTYDTTKITTVEVKRKNGADLVSKNWSIKTQVEDKVPDTFSLSLRNQNDVIPCTYKSTFVTEKLSGLSEETIVAAAVTSTNGTAEISKNGGTFLTSIPSGVTNGDRIDVRMRSNCDYDGPCEIATVVIGERTETWTLCPQQIPFPTVNLQSNATTIGYNESVILTWTSTFATSVTNSSGTGFVGIASTTGSITINNLKSNTTFSITVANSRGSARSSLDVLVAPEPSPRVTLTANPSTINVNGSTTLTWDSTNAVSVVSTAGTGFSNITAVDGSVVVFPTTSTTYSITVRNESGITAKASVNVKVNDPLCPSGAGVYFDLTQFPSITIPVTLSIVDNESTIFHEVNIPGIGVIKENDPPRTVHILGGTVYGPCTAPRGTVYVGNEVVPNIRESGTRPISQLVIEDQGDDWDDMVVSASSGFFRRCTGTTPPSPPPPAPTIVLKTTNPIIGNVATLNPCENLELSWTSTNATSVYSYTGFGFVPKNVSGSLRIDNIKQNTSYSITVSGPSGITTSNTINVVLGKPTVTLSASSTTVSHDGSTVLTWSSTNATSVQSSNFGASSTSGSLTVSNLTSTTSNSTTKTYTITVSGLGGTATASIDITVLPPAPLITISASPSSVPYNGTTTLRWNSTNALSINSNFNAASKSGVSTVSNLIENKTYTITAYGSGQTVSTASTTVLVSQKPPTVNLCAANSSNTYGAAYTECGPSRVIAHKESFILSWTSTDATSVSSYSGSGFIPTATSGSITINGIEKETTYSITVRNSGGTATDTIKVTPSQCAPNVGKTTFENYKLGTIKYNNNTSSSSLTLFTSSTSDSSKPCLRPNYSYSSLHTFIYTTFKEYLRRYPTVGVNGEMNRYIQLFVNQKSTYRLLQDLRSKIKADTLSEVNQIASKGGIKIIEDTCGTNWETSTPVPSSVPCSTTLISDQSSNANYRKGFDVFENGTDGSIQEYFVSTIDTNLPLPNRSSFTYGQIHAYIYSKYSDPVNVGGLGRPPEKNSLIFYVNAFQEKISDGSYRYKTLNDLGNVITASRTNELSNRDSKGGFVCVVNACGEVWPLAGNGVYLDLTSFSSSQTVTVTFRVVANQSQIYHNLNIIGIGRFFKDDSPKTYELKGGRIYGPCSSPNGNVYVGNELAFSNNVRVSGSGSRPNNQIVVEERGDDWDDMVLETSAGIWKRFTAPITL